MARRLLSLFLSCLTCLGVFGSSYIYWNWNELFYQPKFLSGYQIVELKGKLLRHTFPGPPGYHSINEGDTPETCCVLFIDDFVVKKLLQNV